MRSIVLLFVLLLLMTPMVFVFDAGSLDDDILPKGKIISEIPSRKVTESHNVGGLWYDDFSDASGIGSLDNIKFLSGGVGINEVIFEDDFEDYSNGESIAASNKWSMHGTYNEISFYGCDIPLTGAPSNNVMKGDNTDRDVHSMILSKTFDLTSGYFETFVATSQIDHSDHAITQIEIIGTTSSTPTGTDRTLRVGFNYGGFAYYTNSWNTITSGLSENTWYKVAISWDCASYTADISIFDTLGTNLGSATNIAMTNSFTSVKRIGLMCGHMANYKLTTNYWDNLFVMDGTIDDSGAITSVQIDKPDDGYWSGLRIDKVEPGESYIELTLLDQDSTPIPTSQYDPFSSDLDLTFLNDLGVTGIKMIATFNAEGMISPFLEGWGVEWNRSKGWSDTFLTDHKIENMHNMDLRNISLMVESNEEEGFAESIRIRKPQGFYWYRLKTNEDFTYPSYVFYEVLDGNTGFPIMNYTNLTGGNIDLMGIDPKDHRELKLKVRARVFGSMGVSIDRWSLEWKVNSKPTADSIIGPSSIYRNNTAAFQVHVMDDDQDIGELDFDIKYKHENDTQYRTDMIDELTFDGVNGTWIFQLNVPMSAVTGNYSFMVSIEDDFGSRVELEYPGYFQILNNIPIPPTFILTPDNPGTMDDLSVQIIEKAIDVESKILFYTYRWFINDLEMEDKRLEDIWGGSEVSLSSSHTMKGEVVRCEVTVSDGENSSIPSFHSTEIGNTGPGKTTEFTSSISIMEDTPSIWDMDLSTMVTDPDGDVLSYSVSGEENMTISVLTNGSLTIIPQDDWFGTEVVSVRISDGSSNFSFNLTVEVIPVNDPPTGWILTPVRDMEIEVGDTLSFSCSAEDIDNSYEEINMSWLINGSQVGEGDEFTYSWLEHGVYFVELWLDDGKSSLEVENRTITVTDPFLSVDVTGYSKNYNALQGNIIFDIVDMEGTVKNVRSEGFGEYDILSIGSVVVGREVWITMEFSSHPIDPTTLGSGSEAFYEVYFVKEEWGEPVYISEHTNPETPDDFIPPEPMRYKVGTYDSLGYLTFGRGELDYGSPQIEDNKIVWKVPIEVLLNSEVEGDDFELFGYVYYSENSLLQVTKCFDTAGKGSNAHVIDKQPEVSDVEETKAPFLLIVIIAMAILFVIIITAVVIVLVLVIKSKKTEGDENIEVTQDRVDQPQSIPDPSLTGGIVNQQPVKSPVNVPYQQAESPQQEPTVKTPQFPTQSTQALQQIQMDQADQAQAAQPRYVDQASMNSPDQVQAYPNQTVEESLITSGSASQVSQEVLDPPKAEDPQGPQGTGDIGESIIEQQPPSEENIDTA